MQRSHGLLSVSVNPWRWFGGRAGIMKLSQAWAVRGRRRCTAVRCEAGDICDGCWVLALPQS